MILTVADLEPLVAGDGDRGELLEERASVGRGAHKLDRIEHVVL